MTCVTKQATLGLDKERQDGWDQIRFGDLSGFSIQNGLYKPAAAYGSGAPIVRINDFDNSGQFLSRELQRLVVSKKELDRFCIEPGDILINRVNSLSHIGKSVLVRHLAEPTVFESNMMRLRLNSETLLPKFFAYMLQTIEAREFFRKVAKKAVAQASINQEDVKALEFLLPPLAEQRKIASILSTWDEAIALNEQLLAAKQRRKQGLMQRLLTGEVRFPEFVRSEVKQITRYGSLPADWAYVSISEIAHEVSLRSGANYKLPVLSCTKYDGLVDSLTYFGRQIFSKDTSDYKVVKRGQFAYATNHIEEGSIGYQDKFDKALISPMYTVFATTGLTNDLFLYRLLKTEQYRHIFEVNTSGTVNRRGRLGWEDFARINVPLPSLEEQAKIAEFFVAVDGEIELHGRRLEQLRRQKQGLMQRLLTGAVRVPVDG